jgi:hypothetical protein
MKKNNILKFFTIAYLAIVGGLQTCVAMDDDRSPAARRGGSVCSMHSTASYLGVDDGDYFNRKHTGALRDELANAICLALFGDGDNPWFGAPQVNGILEDLSGRLAGGEAEPSFENLVKQRLCEDAVILDMVHRLNTIANPNSPKAIWTVCRAVLFLLSNKKITSCNWLGRISPVDDDVVGHLIGDSGVVPPVLRTFLDAQERIPDLAQFNEDRGAITNVFELSDKFCKAANGFSRELLTARMVDGKRRLFLGRAFSGFRITASMAEIFDSAFLHADFFAHVTPDGMSLVTGISRTSAAAAIASDRLQRAEQERDEARRASASWVPSAKWLLSGAVIGGGAVYFGGLLLLKK